MKKKQGQLSDEEIEEGNDDSVFGPCHLLPRIPNPLFPITVTASITFPITVHTDKYKSLQSPNCYHKLATLKVKEGVVVVVVVVELQVNNEVTTKRESESVCVQCSGLNIL